MISVLLPALTNTSTPLFIKIEQSYKPVLANSYALFCHFLANVDSDKQEQDERVQ